VQAGNTKHTKRRTESVSLPVRGSIPGRGWDSFLLATASGSALGTIQPPIQWVPGALPQGVKHQVVKLITHFHLVSRLMRGAIPPLTQYVMVRYLVKQRDNLTFTFQFSSYLGFHTLICMSSFQPQMVKLVKFGHVHPKVGV